MANYRQFTITNEAGTESIVLNDFNGYLATSPTGLGIYRQAEYITIGNQRVSTNNAQTFQKITLNVLIMGSRSEWENKYAVLRDFISRNLGGGFRLYYTPQEETRYIKCDILIADKTEKDKANLPVKLDIQPLSLWLTDSVASSIRQGEQAGNLFEFAEHDGSYYAGFELMQDVYDEYNRPVYAIEFKGNTKTIATLNNVGTEETPLLIKVFGYAVNPYIVLREYGKEQVSQYVRFDDLTIEEGYYLEISSDATDTHIELVNNVTGERLDREDFVDIESNMFLTLPKGRWNIELTDESGENECYAEIYFANKYYGG